MGTRSIDGTSPCHWLFLLTSSQLPSNEARAIVKQDWVEDVPAPNTAIKTRGHRAWWQGEKPPDFRKDQVPGTECEKAASQACISQNLNLKTRMCLPRPEGLSCYEQMDGHHGFHPLSSQVGRGKSQGFQRLLECSLNSQLPCQ